MGRSRIGARAFVPALVGALIASLVLVAPSMGIVEAREPDDGAARQAASSSGTYIVRLVEDPAAGYEGGISGLAATRPAQGKKIDPNDANVRRYVAYLAQRHDDVASAVGARADKFYDYYYAFNGFAAKLSAAQAQALGKRADVASVDPDALARIDTDNTPTFLGLDGPGGLWAQLGGPGQAGEGVIVGALDTGIWPEHPSFSDRADLGDGSGSSGEDLVNYGPPPAGWNGSCQSGELWSQDDCNRKVIGARYYLNGFGHFGVITNDYLSARDADGHGSHTASTAAGNHGVAASVLGSDLGTISGMAPRARIAAYKVCWNGEAGGCANTDTVAAIDQATADGVDVINYSISGTSTNFLDPVEVAFLFANVGGVFVAASAGNSGPGASTVNHPSPWLTTVGASTQNRSFQGTVTLGSGSTYTGVTLTGGIGSTPIVDSVAAGSELCFVGALDPTAVSGKIVLCKRGVTARVDKSRAVKEAGGVGMVLYNASDTQTLNTDNHWVPSLHINNTNGLAVKAYIAGAGASATASLSGGTKVFGGGNTMADFSSRGPARGAGGDVLKPDVTAPGVNILAGNSPTAFLGAPGQLFQAITGTSMSSPHVAGVAALLKHAHADWSPSRIKSALMTSARQNVKKENGITPATPHDMGAGHIDPNPAADPGLAYDLGFTDYRGFLRGQGLCTFCFGTSPAPIIRATDLNLASFGNGRLAGSQTTSRTVTNVGSSTATYKVSVDEPPGIAVTVSPASLALAPGATATYSVTFERKTKGKTAAFNVYTFGSLTWSDGTHDAYSPIAIRPVPLSAPSSVSGTGTSGSVTYQVRFGYSGTFNAVPRGLKAATTTAASVADDPTNDFDTTNPEGNQGFTRHDVVIPAGALFARFSLFNAYTDGAHDLDVYVYRGLTGSTLVGASTGGTADEQVDLTNPSANTYRVYVHGWQTEGGGTANYTLFEWQVNSSDTGTTLGVTAPTTATSGATASITASWSGLATGVRYLGLIRYDDGSIEVGRTLVTVRTD